MTPLARPFSAISFCAEGDGGTPLPAGAGTPPGSPLSLSEGVSSPASAAGEAWAGAAAAGFAAAAVLSKKRSPYPTV